jgi:hypothetical protein
MLAKGLDRIEKLRKLETIRLRQAAPVPRLIHRCKFTRTWRMMPSSTGATFHSSGSQSVYLWSNFHFTPQVALIGGSNSSWFRRRKSGAASKCRPAVDLAMVSC